MNNIRIAETCTLPSRGQIYTEDVNPEVVLSSMKAKHEMLRLSATDGSQKIMASIIDDCIESDVGISSYDMCLGDFQFLLYKLRIVTFGPEYELNCECPVCRYRQALKVNLDDFYINEYDDSIIGKTELELPKSGDQIRLTLQTPKILDRIAIRDKEYRRRHKNSDENPTLLHTIMETIEEINGEKVNEFKLEEYIKELPLADANAILKRIDELNNDIGVDMFMENRCKVCGSTYQVPFRITPAFFGPDNI